MGSVHSLSFNFLLGSLLRVSESFLVISKGSRGHFWVNSSCLRL
jgi:hypothetical protein